MDKVVIADELLAEFAKAIYKDVKNYIDENE